LVFHISFSTFVDYLYFHIIFVSLNGVFSRSVYLYFICIIFSSININNFSKFNIAIFSFKSNHIIFENDVDISRSHVEIKEISIVI